MRLYLREELMKSKDAKAGSDKPVAPSKQGSQRGGDYVARTQVGYEKDGSPKYRYFKTQEAYDEFLNGKGEADKGKKLAEKVTKEHEESSEKQKPGLLARDKPVEKSLRLYVRG